MRGLRDNGVITLGGQHDGVAGVIEDQIEPRVLQGVPPPDIADRLVGADHQRLQLHHIEVADVGRHAIQGDAAAKTYDQHGTGVRPRQGGQPGQPLLRVVHRRHAAPGDGGLRQPVAGQGQEAIQIAHQNGGGLAHPVEMLRAPFLRARRLGMEQRFGAAGLNEQQGCEERQRRKAENRPAAQP